VILSAKWPITGNLDTEAIFLRFWQNPPHTGSQSIQVPYLENAGGHSVSNLWVGTGFADAAAGFPLGRAQIIRSQLTPPGTPKLFKHVGLRGTVRWVYPLTPQNEA
jgi:hypothetical protein